MYAISNAFLYDAEIVQTDRWAWGPLELALLNMANIPTELRFKLQMGIHEWNQCHAAGSLRHEDAFDAVTKGIPGIERRQNPNIIVVPRDASGLTELHVMLASLLPDESLKRCGLERLRPNMSLMMVGRDALGAGYKEGVEAEFSRFIWSRLTHGSRRSRAFFSATSSPLRLLSGDIRYWMHRLYRVALYRREMFQPTPEERQRVSLEDVKAELARQVGADYADRFAVRRPLVGGHVWFAEDAGERDAVIGEALGGAGVMESLAPVIELLNTQHAHEDFSSRYSWVKEDFERSFHSKRARLRVQMIQSVDDAPVWDVSECDGYQSVLERDVFAALDLKSRTLLLALRAGKTVCELGRDAGLTGHASISRQVQRLQAKLRQILM